MNVDAWRLLLRGWDRRREDEKREQGAASALIEAARHDDWRRAGALIERGCAPNLRGEARMTPLMFAARFDSSKVLELLLAAGAEIGAQDESGRDALLHAIEMRSDQCCRILCAKGAGERRLSSDMSTSLILASRIGYALPVRLLTRTKPSLINAADSSGRNALWHCLSKPQPSQEDSEIAHILLSAGENPDAADIGGVTARSAAGAQAAKSALEALEIGNSLEPLPEIAPEAIPEADPSAPKRSFRI